MAGSTCGTPRWANSSGMVKRRTRRSNPARCAAAAVGKNSTFRGYGVRAGQSAAEAAVAVEAVVTAACAEDPWLRTHPSTEERIARLMQLEQTMHRAPLSPGPYDPAALLRQDLPRPRWRIGGTWF